MKKIKYIVIALACVCLSGCMADDYDAPQLNQSPYGNNELTETKVLSIAQLKQQYQGVIAASGLEEITEDIQIKGWVTGNDVEGNIYNQFAMQDETGAILISVAQGGLYGYLPVGQEVLISLKGLIIGGYGSQAQVGGIYINKRDGSPQVGRMNRFVWMRHFKLLGTPQPEKVKPTVFDQSKISNQQYLTNNSGMLMTLKNVQLEGANGKVVFAPKDGSIALTANAANRALKGINSKTMVVRTSTFADFANQPMPTGAVDITGVFTRFRNTWQILLRSADDIKPAK